MRALLCILGLLLAIPATAAAEVTVRVDVERRLGNSETPDFDASLVTVQAGAEANDLTVTVSPLVRAQAPRAVTIRDARVPVEPGPGCAAVDEHEVRCEPESLIAVTVLSGSGDDRVAVPAPAPVTVRGGPGADELRGAAQLEGDDGDDRLVAAAPGAVLAGGPGDDRLDGHDGTDTLRGGGGTDVLRGGAGADLLADEDGAAPGPDVLAGGTGADTVDYGDRRAAVVLALPDRPAGAAAGDTLSGVESAVGGAGPDRITGTAGRNTLDGGAGDDRLDGLAGADTLEGRDGDDRLHGGAGRDVASAGAGRDRVLGGAGADQLYAVTGRDALHGGPGDDVLAGGLAADRLAGGPGRDELSGGPGEDRLDGGAGGDTLQGGALSDVLRGGPGADVLTGTGDFFRDTARCGAGRDRAVLDPGDRPSGCERAVRRPARGIDRPRLVERFASTPPRGGARYPVSRGRVALRLDCLDLGLRCAGRLVATARAGGRRVQVLSAVLRCDEPVGPQIPSCDSGVGEGRLTAIGRRLVRSRGTLRARAVIHLAPGPRRGALPLRDRLTLRPASPAAATNVRVKEVKRDRGRGGPVSRVFVETRGGARNDIVVRSPRRVRNQPRFFVVRDARDPVTPGAACTALGEHAVRCKTVGPRETVMVDAGRGDDRVLMAGPMRGFLDGGPGDDRLTGGGGRESLEGGGGTDVLRGGGSRDLLADSDGADPGADVMDGGGGRDTVDYSGRRRPVAVRLRDRSGGAAGERDRLRGFESAIGGGASDRLVGTGGINGLRGGGGADRLEGGGGRDYLFGEAGPDTLAGGRSSDEVLGGPGADAIVGGDGDDRVVGGAGPDRLAGGGGKDALAGSTGEDRIDGGAGDDSLDGGARSDRLDGGPGDDRLAASADFFADLARCGSGRDAVSLDRGDRQAGCERMARGYEPDGRPFLADDLGDTSSQRRDPIYDVAGGRASLLLNCDSSRVRCRSRIKATARAGNRRITVLRGSLRCARYRAEEPCGLARAQLRLTRGGRRLLAARGRVRAAATIHLHPGARAGALPIRDRLILRKRVR